MILISNGINSIVSAETSEFTVKYAITYQKNFHFNLSNSQQSNIVKDNFNSTNLNLQRDHDSIKLIEFTDSNPRNTQKYSRTSYFSNDYNTLFYNYRIINDTEEILPDPPILWKKKSCGVYYWPVNIDAIDYLTPMELVLMSGKDWHNLFGAKNWTSSENNSVQTRFNDGYISDGLCTVYCNNAGNVSRIELKSQYQKIMINIIGYKNIGGTQIAKKIATSIDLNNGKTLITRSISLISYTNNSGNMSVKFPMQKLIEDYRKAGDDLTVLKLSPGSTIKPIQYIYKGRLPTLDQLNDSKDNYLADISQDNSLNHVIFLILVVSELFSIYK